MIDRSLPIPNPARAFLLAMRGVNGKWTTQLYKSETAARNAARCFYKAARGGELEELEAWIIYLEEEGRALVKKPDKRVRLRIVR